jgi:UDP-glucose 4-epimerase
MKVLVTGGAGFAGSHIADALIAAGHEVVIVDNLVTGSRENVPQAAAFYQLDINDPKLVDVIADERIEAICHQAAQVKVPESIKHPEHDANVNIIGTIKLLEAARHLKLKRFLFAGSAAIYGQPDYLPVDEEHPLRPMSFYGLSKKVDEEYIRMYGELFGVNYMILRYANIYGPRQGRYGEGGVVSIFLENMLKDQPVTIDGDGGATRDYIYIGDVAQAVRLALESDVVGTVNVSTETQVSVNELFATMKRLTGYKRDPIYGPARVGDIYHSTLANRRILKLLPWRPTTSLEEGLTKTIEWGRTVYGPDKE